VADAIASDAAPRGMRAPFRHRDFRLLTAGLAISQTGDWLYNVALLVLVLRATGSPAWVAAAGVVRLLPYVLFGTLGGVVADRYRRKRVMIASDLARAAVMVLLGFVDLSGGSAAFAIGLAGLATTFAVAYGPAEAASLQLIVDEDELAAANSVTTTIMNVCIALGPAVGGVLLLLGSSAIAFFVNAVTFLGSAAMVSGIRTNLGPLRAEEHEQSGGTWDRVREGISAIASSPDVVVLVAAWCANAFLYGGEIVLLVLLAAGRLGIGGDGLSFLYAAFGVGGVLAAAVAHRAADRSRQGVILGLATIVTGLSFAGFAFTQLPAVGYALVALDGAGSIVLDVLVLTSLQRMLGNDVMGRAMGAVDSLVVGAMLLGSIVAPPLVDALEVPGAVLAVAGIVVAAGLLVLVRAHTIDRRAAARVEELAPRVALLYALDIFMGASRATLEALAAELRPQQVRAGEVVLREGHEPDDLYVVASGRLAVTTERMGHVGELHDRDYFGEIGLLHRIPRTATVTAVTDCDLWRMSGETFLRLVNEGGQRSASLSGNVASRLAATRTARPEDPAS
jgi:CRP-like cAMP-binding protein/predicted MFS family arabinose efflux permease